MKRDFSIPTPFKSRYESLVSQAERESLWQAMAHPLRPSLRVNTLKTTTSQWLELSAAAGWNFEPIPWYEEGLWVPADAMLSKSLPFFVGLCYLQESASMLPPLVLDPRPGEIVVDMAAAPGSKTTQMAQMMQNQGLIVANDKDTKRIKSLVFNLEKYGVTNAAVSTYDGKELGNLLPSFADKVLLDAPCSAEGAIPKDGDYFDFWKPERSLMLAHVQKELLRAALKVCKVGGTIVYSTCTLSPDENECVIQWMLESYGDSVALEAVPESLPFSKPILEWEGQTFSPEVGLCGRILPHLVEAGAFFVAKIRKVAEIETNPSHRQTTPKSNPLTLLTPSKAKAVKQKCIEMFELPANVLDDFEIVERRRETLWIYPKQAIELNTLLPIDRAGIPLGQVFNESIRFSFPFSRAFGAHANKQIVELSDKQAEQYMRGQSVMLDVEQINALEKGQIFLRWQGYAIGRALFQPPDYLKSQIKPSYVVY